jgi:glycosyltransferase involved in cell wall biosynthesis
MAYVVNPAGRIVAVENEIEAEKWLQTPGFRKPTDQELQETIAYRTQLAQNVKQNIGEMKATGVYMATVSQGGKDGYSVASAKMLAELQRLGVNITTHNAGQKIALLFHNPYSILRLEAPYRILYTMFESDKLPDDWRDYLEAADKILVPSKWCQQIFAKAGFETTVVPLGYDDRVFTYKPRIDKRAARQDFVFMHYNAFNLRKGFTEVFKAFCKAFDKTEPVRMIFKTTLEHNPLPITKAEYPNIDIIHGKITEYELRDLLYKADCFVYPARGEGFGITPLEAMATGIPAIVPNAHGITEYFDADYMYEAKVDSYCPAIYSRYKNQDVGKMVVCDVDQLAQQMRYVYEHQDEAREKGRKAAEYVKRWTFQKTAENLKRIFEGASALNLAERPLKNTLRLEAVR